MKNVNRGRQSMRLQWMNEFSDIGSACQSHQELKLVMNKAGSVQMNKESGEGPSIDDSNSIELDPKKLKRKSCILTLQKLMETH